MIQPRYIAMWSGPRNISTAMLRAWGSRADTFVHDEPLYAHYLSHTGYPHPGAADVIAAYETDWRKVVTSLTGAVPQGKTIYYQKHMTHHMLPHIEREWLLQLTNCFLIREPRRVLISLAKVLPNPTLQQTGFPQQVALFEYVRQQTGRTPPVLDAKDVLTDPHGALNALCAAVEVPFDDAMLSWEAGGRDTDGVWAPHWYAAVEKSTGFAPYAKRNDTVPPHLHGLLAECNALYEQLAAYRLARTA